MDALQSLAAHLASRRPDPQARMNYDLFAGGLFWSDECPIWDEVRDGGEIGCWRVLLAYRASLIIGEPRVKFTSTWEQFQSLCPQWPGFAPERRDPSLAGRLRELNEAGTRSWDEANERYERQQAAGRKASA